MRNIHFVILAVAMSACTPTPQNKAQDRSQFDVVRGGVNIDQLMVACANNPKIGGLSHDKSLF